MRLAQSGIMELQKSVDTLIIIPNQNLFRVANEKTTFTDAFAMADQVLHSGVACITATDSESIANPLIYDVSMLPARIASAHPSGRGPRDPSSSAFPQRVWAQRIVHYGLRSLALQVTVLIPSRVT
jgi:hypothetical protein